MNILGNLKVPACVFFDLLNAHTRVVRCQIHFPGFSIKAQETHVRNYDAGASSDKAVCLPFLAPIKESGRSNKINLFRKALLEMSHHNNRTLAAHPDVI